MSEHKTGNPSFDKELYRERRKRGLNGVARPVTVYKPVIDEEGNQQHVELGNKTGSMVSVRKSSSERRHHRRHFTSKQSVMRRLIRASGRGE